MTGTGDHDGAQAPLREHALRRELAEEIRARPYQLIAAPAQISFLAVVLGERGGEEAEAHLARLCADRGAPPPAPGASHHDHDFGAFQLKWERHTEFCSYTFCRPGAVDRPFADTALDLVPADWLADLPGAVLVATHVVFEGAEAPPRESRDIAALFATERISGSGMLGGRARVWTDFHIAGDGFGRILVRDQGLNRRAAGRLVQRLLEVEAYRMMAMLALPVAKEAQPQVYEAERRLGELIARLAEGSGVDEEQDLLKRLSGLAAGLEALAAGNTYRFSAARAYYGLVQRRVEELREERIEGLQPPGEFLYRRLVPAMDTCASVAERQAALSRRIAQASDLLRTRVDVALEAQNKGLLESMDRRARLQLRLQETVEGLSVVAISYYLIGLVSYAAKSLHAMGLPVNAELSAGVALPVVLGLVWVGVRRLRRAVTGHKGGPD
ncbi:MAG: DUF3422 domain-containing protein [Hyphomicrobiales bacterium]|nr:DUF3422 domain-containing protein [Hyphomicrobiales bacterium]